MEGIITTAITTIGTVIIAVISKKTSKKIEKIESVKKADLEELKKDIKSDVEEIKKQHKEEMDKHILEADKTFLTNFLSDLEQGIPKTDIQKQRAYEVFEEYVNHNGNSYVHDKWEECKIKNLL